MLQEAGKKCIVLEANNLCFGTTGGTTAHLNTLLDTPYTTISKNFDKEKAKLVAQSVKEAIDLIRHNITTYKIDCGFEETDAFLFAQDEKQEKELEDIKEATVEARCRCSICSQFQSHSLSKRHRGKRTGKIHTYPICTWHCQNF